MASLLCRARARQRGLACLLLLSYLPACSTWHTGTPTPAQFIEKEHPEAVRVIRMDGTTVNLEAPAIRGDSLVGTVGGGLVQADSARTISLALSDVSSVAVKRGSAGRTLLLVGGVLIATMVIVYAVECSGKSGWESIGCP